MKPYPKMFSYYKDEEMTVICDDKNTTFIALTKLDADQVRHRLLENAFNIPENGVDYHQFEKRIREITNADIAVVNY